MKKPIHCHTILSLYNYVTFFNALFFTILITGATSVYSQTSTSKVKPFEMKGYIELSGQYSSREPVYQYLSQNYLHAKLRNTAYIYGIPVSMHAYFSTEQSKYRQSLNTLTLVLDTRKLANNHLLKNHAFLSWFKTLEIGRCRPTYSDFVLSGIALDGINIALQKGVLYSAFVYGRTARNVSYSSQYFPTEQRNVMFGKVGLGKPKSSHLFISLLHSEDDETSVTEEDKSNFTPSRNYTGSIDAMLKMFLKKFTIGGEVAVSEHTRDKYQPSAEFEDIPDYVNDALSPNISSTLDYAVSAFSELALKNTKASVAVKSIGPGYQSYGIPYLRQDNIEYEGKFSQYFFKPSFMLKTFIKKRDYNRFGIKGASTSSLTYGFIAGLRIRKLPYLQVVYRPFKQSNHADEMSIENNMTLLSILSSYNKKIGSIMNYTTVSYSLHDYEYNYDENQNTGKNITFSVNENLVFKQHYGINAGYTLRDIQYSFTQRMQHIYKAGIMFYLWKKWKNYLNVSLTDAENMSTKSTLQYRTLIKLFPFADLEVQARQVVYKSNNGLYSPYDEYIINGKLKIKW
jgi:hypothetical protein